MPQSPSVERANTRALRLAMLSSLGLLAAACDDNTAPLPDVTAGRGAMVQCTDPVVGYNGLVWCAERFWRRPEAPDCQAASGVSSDAAPPAGACFGDHDCAPDEACLCALMAPGKCVPASCHVDGSCAPREVCTIRLRAAHGGAGGATTVSVLACAEPPPAPDPSAGGVNAAFPTGGTVGRPFLVDAVPRLPSVASSDAWSRLGVRPCTEQLSPEARHALAQRWTRLGQMEHASIAAFARFSLQLLSLGAPASLVEACTQALADETAHAALCFGLASAYAGYAIGPGPLDIERSLQASTLVDILDLVIVEGCFGETSAALEALEAAEGAADPVIQRVHARIAEDEQRHAELAFRFVRWALQQDPTAVRERLQTVLQSPLPQHRAAWDVVLPCLSALLA